MEANALMGEFTQKDLWRTIRDAQSMMRNYSDTKRLVVTSDSETPWNQAYLSTI